jgi:hypothetical protein
VTLVQRFGSALNLNVHLHMLVLDGAYLTGTQPPVFRRIAAPSARELQALVEGIAERSGQVLERKGLLVRDCDNSFLSFDPAAGNECVAPSREGCARLCGRLFVARCDRPPNSPSDLTPIERTIGR